MFQLDRTSLASYAKTIKGLTNEELHKEIWMLEEHVKHLTTVSEESGYFQKFLYVAKQEREMRMVAQGYQ
jgi:hypothetical protein